MPYHKLINYPDKVQDKDNITPASENVTSSPISGGIGAYLSELTDQVNGFSISDDDEAAVQFNASIDSINSRFSNLAAFTSSYSEAEIAYTKMNGYKKALIGDGEGGVYANYKQTVERYNRLLVPNLKEGEEGYEYATKMYNDEKRGLETKIINYETTCQELVDNIDTCRTLLTGVNEAVPTDGAMELKLPSTMKDPSTYNDDEYTNGNYSGDYQYNSGNDGQRYYTAIWNCDNPKYKELCESLGVEPRETGGIMEVKTVDEYGNTHSTYAFVDSDMTEDDRKAVELYLSNNDGLKGSATLDGNYNFRTGPGMSNESQFVIPSGAEVEVLGTEGNWVRVMYDGKEGYIYKDGLTNVTEPTSLVDCTNSTPESGEWIPVTSNGQVADKDETPTVYVQRYNKIANETPASVELQLPDGGESSTYRYRTGNQFNAAGTTSAAFGDSIQEEGTEVYFSGSHTSLIVRGVNSEDTNVRLDGNDMTSVVVYGEYKDSQYGDRYIIKLADGTYGTISKQYFTTEKPSS